MIVRLQDVFIIYFFDSTNHNSLFETGLFTKTVFDDGEGGMSLSCAGVSGNLLVDGDTFD